MAVIRQFPTYQAGVAGSQRPFAPPVAADPHHPRQRRAAPISDARVSLAPPTDATTRVAPDLRHVADCAGDQAPTIAIIAMG